MFSQIHQGGIKPWHILKNVLKGEEIVRYSNGWNPLSSKPQLKKIKNLHRKMREERKEEATVAPSRKPQASRSPQEGKKNKKKAPKNPTGCRGQCLQHGQNLDGIQGQRRAKNESTTFTK
ncbi:hypothetical protein O181_049320 [Austropuccinia psidii MF-1]|uniref:Uncharacterized protein n=1 Tax=Austropuccinia psidii MF-1 TaxID=1389203 RepID=A0A9Q3HPY3_9BASI|nr:hypothetical protein [Austropuccinia psidii MF-1]